MIFSLLNNFGLGANPPAHTITDATNYAGQGIVAANVTGILKLTGPAGVYYINPGYINDDYSAPDIFTPAFLKSVNLPLNGDGIVEQGTYYVDYKIKVAFQQMSRPIIAVNQGNNSITVGGDHVAEITSSINSNITGSTGNDGAYTLGSVSLVGGNTVVVFLNPPLPSAIANGFYEYQANQYYQAPQQTLIYTVDEPCAKIEITADCGCAKLASRDVTVYGVWTIVQRTHTLIYPTGSNVPDVVSSAALIQINDLWTNTYVGQLSVNISYSPSTGFTITNTITAQKDFKVVCDAGLCCIYTCLKAVITKYIQLKANGSQAEAQRYFNIYNNLLGYWMLYSISHACGDEDEMALHLAAMKAIINTECGDCGCNDDCDDGATTQVTPYCGPSGGGGGSSWIYDVVACNGNNLIQVSANTVNDTVTFTVCADEGQFEIFVEGLIAQASIGDLADVTITAVQDGQALVWDQGAGQWVNQFIEYNNLNDVDVTSDPLQNGDMMIWDQVNQVWVNVRRDGIIHNNRTIVKTDATVGTWQVLQSFSVPAGRLAEDGAEIRFTTGFILLPPENDYIGARILVNAVGLKPQFVFTPGPSQETFRGKGVDLASGKTSLTPTMAYHEVSVTRISNLLVKTIMKTIIQSGFLFLQSNTFTNEFEANIAVADLDNNALPISIEGRNETLAVAEKVQATHLMVEKISKIV